MVANPLEEFYCGFNVLPRPLPRLCICYLLGFQSPALAAWLVHSKMISSLY